MTNPNHLLREFSARPGATDEQISSAETKMGVKFPEGYSQFLRRQNGGEGAIGESYAMLWDVSELASKNESYRSNEWAPGFLIFGSDGGGEAFGFDTRNPMWPIVRIPFIGMEWGAAEPLGDTFDQFLDNLYEGNWL